MSSQLFFHDFLLWGWYAEGASNPMRDIETVRGAHCAAVPGMPDERRDGKPSGSGSTPDLGSAERRGFKSHLRSNAPQPVKLSRKMKQYLMPPFQYPPQGARTLEQRAPALPGPG